LTRDGKAAEPTVVIDRFKALDKNDREYSVFYEVQKRFAALNPEMFRLEVHQKAWKVVLLNEHSVDAGGPYRECIQWICDEVQSSMLPLFVRTPNAQNDVGKFRDRWVPNPKCRDADKYNFLGKLMGLSLRTKELLNLNFAPIVWKKLCNMEVKFKDVLDIDQFSVQILKRLNFLIDDAELANPTENAETEDLKQLFDRLMERLDQRFSFRGSDGKMCFIDQAKHLNHRNIEEFKNAMLKFRIEEFDFACRAMRKGLSTVVPIHYLSLFTPEELEKSICGSPVMNVDLLQSMTTYGDCKSSDRVILLFWQMVRTLMSEEERAALLSFVWGRSRLPTSADDFDKKMKIEIMSIPDDKNPDDYLPIAHTCFFQLDLPMYSSLNSMYEKVLIAITHCKAIDMDE